MPCGGTAITWLQASDRACTSAPCASSTLTTSGCFCATAHMSAVWPRVARALTFAPLASNCSTTSGLPDREATISGVSPSEQRDVRIRAGLQQPPHHRRAAVQARHPERRGAEIVGGIDFRTGRISRSALSHVIAIARPVKRGRAVGLGRVDVDALLEQRRSAS